VQGIGGALSEELMYDSAGQLVTASFLDYQIPRSTDVPNIEIHHSETPSGRNPLGIKGVGEAGTIGSAAAIAGAIEDAVAMYDITIDRTPMPPSYVAGLLDQSGG
jgi:carbon-monoxide dehydrogenase large subunit